MLGRVGGIAGAEWPNAPPPRQHQSRRELALIAKGQNGARRLRIDTFGCQG